MKIERRLRDRGADAASDRWLGKLVVFAVLVTIAVYALLQYARANH
jgi:hypothetical protein